VLAIGEREVDCVVTDLSRSGAAALVSQATGLLPGSEVRLVLPEYGDIAASVRHVDGDNVGLLLIDGFQGELPPPSR